MTEKRGDVITVRLSVKRDHVITVTDDQRCGTCGRFVGWTAFTAPRLRDIEGWPLVVSFLRHYR